MIDPEVIVKIENSLIKRLGHQPGKEVQFTLLNGKKVDKSFYHQVLKLILDILDGIETDVYYTAREMCGEDFWFSIRMWNRKLAGMCFADAVQRGWVPFAFKPQRRKDRSTRRYKINPNYATSTTEEG